LVKNSTSTTSDDGNSLLRRRLSRFFFGILWLVTLSLLAVAILRVFYHDGTNFLTWLDAFTRYVYLPAYVCLAIALWKRRWFLAVANMVIVALHVSWLAPDFIRDKRFDLPAQNASTEPSARTVRIFFANVNAQNTNHDALLSEMQAANPDVIVLVEFSWLWHLAYLHNPFFAGYPYGSGMQNATMGTVNVFSRLPLKTDKQEWIGSRAVQTIEIPLGSETLRVIGLHAPRPMRIRDDDYVGYWNRMIPKLEAENGPLVVVGDFNATQYSRVYQQLTSGRLRSAHQDRGRGYATSWPNGQILLPPIRIDQALLSPEIECLDSQEGEGRGSDHKPLILDVRLRPHE
jgi:endonuclease/exonuclease/phosphatase (EEP) superfamily protein YafD